MAPMIPIQPAIATLTPADQDDLEGNLEPSPMNSTTSVNKISEGGHDRDSIIGHGQGGSDTAAQVIASVWSKKHLIAAYGLIWFIIAVCSTFDNILTALGPYVASAFQLHSYAAATGIVANVVAGLSPVPLAKLVRKFGRAQGLVAMLGTWIIGLVMLAACQNVSAFTAAQVFTSIGSTGVTYCISLFVADTTSLRNRGFLMSFSTSPDIITMWLGGPIASSLLTGIGWRWGFGIFSIVLPVTMAPLIALILWNQRKAFRTGLLRKHDVKCSPDLEESAWSPLKRFVLEVDLAGLLILACGLSLLLLPFTLYSFQPKTFASPLIASFIAVGIALIIIYALYEHFLAPTTSIPFAALRDRTVLLAIITIFVDIIAFTTLFGYFTSWLQVVTGLSIAQTSYLTSSIKVAICVWTLLIGVLVRWTGHLKLLVLTTGIPLMMVAAGIFLNFRLPSENGLGVMIGVVLLSSFSLGTASLCGTLIMMATLGQDHNTTILALIAFLSNVAPAMGEAVSTGIWTGTFKQSLHRHLPTLTDDQIDAIYSSLKVQLSFPKGSAIREGIELAYVDAKYYMLIVSLCLLGVAMVSTLFWRDRRVKEVKDPRMTEASTSGRSA